MFMPLLRSLFLLPLSFPSSLLVCVCVCASVGYLLAHGQMCVQLWVCKWMSSLVFWWAAGRLGATRGGGVWVCVCSNGCQA